MLEMNVCFSMVMGQLLPAVVVMGAGFTGADRKSL
jgi:hypothetical protein